MVLPRVISEFLSDAYKVSAAHLVYIALMSGASTYSYLTNIYSPRVKVSGGSTAISCHNIILYLSPRVTIMGLLHAVIKTGYLTDESEVFDFLSSLFLSIHETKLSNKFSNLLSVPLLNI